jgi:hypothetical protein
MLECPAHWQRPVRCRTAFCARFVKAFTAATSVPSTSAGKREIFRLSSSVTHLRACKALEFGSMNNRLRGKY